MEDKLLSGIFKLRASSISFLDADGFITWGDDELLFSADTSDWSDYETNFGRVSLLAAINSLAGGVEPVGAITWSGTTTTDSVTEIFLNGEPSDRYSLTLNSTEYFNLVCIARDNANNKTKVWEIKVVTTTLSGGTSSEVRLTPIYTVIDQTDPSGGTNDWNIIMDVNSASDTLVSYVFGQSGCTIQWAVSS